MITFDVSHAHLNEEISAFQKQVDACHAALMNKSGKGNDYVGWVEWPNTYDKEEFSRLKQCAKRMAKMCDVFVVCGIGGSYLGARAAVEMMNGLFPKQKPEILFIGNTFYVVSK